MKQTILMAMLTCATMHAAAIDYTSMRLYWSNQPGEFATGGTEVTLASDFLFTFQTGFTFQSELCEEGSCSVPTPGNSPLGLRLTDTLVTCQVASCGGWFLAFTATGTLNSPVTVSLSMDNLNWNTANPVFGLVQVASTQSGSMNLTFNSSSSSAGPSNSQVWSTPGPIEIDGIIQFVFPQGAVALSAGDTFQMMDSLVMNVTPLDAGPGPGTDAPEPGAGALAIAGTAILYWRRNKR